MSLFRSISNEEEPAKMINREQKNDKREIGHHAAWSLSSAKPGFGVEQLRDNNLGTYWQSDGPQPHFVNIQFHKKVEIEEIKIYCDMKLDESYTPNKISVRSGTTFHDLQEIKVIEIGDPNGWISIPLSHPKKPNNQLKTNFIQMAILGNHQNGRDTHIRQVKVYGPQVCLFQKHPEFKTEDFVQYTTLR